MISDKKQHVIGIGTILLFGIIAIIRSTNPERFDFYWHWLFVIALISSIVAIIIITPSVRMYVHQYLRAFNQNRKKQPLQYIFGTVFLLSAGVLIYQLIAHATDYRLLSTSLTQIAEILLLTSTVCILLTTIDTKRKRKKNKRVLMKTADWGFLALAIVIAFAIRVWNIDYLSPSTDEFPHILAAKRFLQEGTFHYYRGAITTYTTAFLMFVSDLPPVTAGRLSSVFFGTAAIIPIFFIGKYINRTTAWIAVFLWVFSPIAVGYSRYARMYASYAFLFSLYFWIAIETVHSFTQSSIFSKRSVNLLFVLLTSVLLQFTIFRETPEFKALFLLLAPIAVYAAFIAHAEIKAQLTNPSIMVAVYAVIGITLSISIVYVVFFSDLKTLIADAAIYNPFFFDLLFSPLVQYEGQAWQWFTTLPISTILIFGILLLGILNHGSNKTYVGLLSSGAIGFAILAYKVDKNISRAVVFLLPFYILLLAAGISTLITYKKKYALSHLMTSSAIILTVLLFSPITVIQEILNEAEFIIDNKTGLVHLDSEATIDYLELHTDFSPDETLITSNTLLFSYIYDYDYTTLETLDQENRTIRYNRSGDMLYDYTDIYAYPNPNSPHKNGTYGGSLTNGISTIKKVIESNPTGWIVVHNFIYDQTQEQLWNVTSETSLEYVTRIYPEDRLGYTVLQW